MKNLHVVILAAGQGSRMRSALPKVLHTISGKPMLAHVADSAASLNPDRTHVVYGHGGERVQAEFVNNGFNWVEQSEQLGTGHAVQQVLPALGDAEALLVLYGDVPLVTAETMAVLVEELSDASVAVLSTRLQNPMGYGRIIRDAQGQFTEIVEQKDGNAQQLAVDEVNTGLMAIRADAFSLLQQLDNNNAQQEYYLTDLISLARQQGLNVSACVTSDANEVAGVNNRAQQAEAESVYRARRAADLMIQGVTLVDPKRIDVRGGLDVGKDVYIDVNCVFEGDVELGDNVVIEPNCVLRNCKIAEGTRIKSFSHVDGAVIGKQSDVGPYARLREGTYLSDNCKIGNFVETKKTSLGDGSKVSHLSYIGDAQIGSGVNIGAGTITCNYDGVNKHQTVIGDDAFVGSGTQLVAPVKVGSGATIGAGSTLRHDAPEQQLTLTKGRSLTVEGWQRPTKNKSN